MNLRYTLMLLVLLPFAVFAQKKNISAAEKYYKDQYYYKAAEEYRIAFKSSKLKLKPAKAAEAYFQYAECSRITYNYKRAEEYYQKVVEGEFTERFPTVIYWYAESLRRNGKFAKAEGVFQQFLEVEAPTKYLQELQRKAKQSVLAAKVAQELMKKPDRGMQIQHMGDEVNTKYSDFSPHLVGDTLYYSSLRYERKLQRGRVRTNDGTDGNRHLVGKVMFSKNRGAERFYQLNSPNVNVKFENSGNSKLSPDSKMLYFTKCAKNKQGVMICQIYACPSKPKGLWGKAVKLPENINQEDITSTHPCIGYDSIKGRQVLYFVSDRPGGFGKKDIWMSEILGNNQFSEPINLGDKINTEDDEISPFFHNTTQSLYFSSKWLPGMGGFDVFVAKRQGDGFEAPVNAGIPLNSAANDLYFIINNDDSTGFFCSNRPGSRILTGESCCNDIYSLKLKGFPPVFDQEEKEPEPLLVEEIPLDSNGLLTSTEEILIEEDTMPTEIVAVVDEPAPAQPLEEKVDEPVIVLTKEEKITLEGLNGMLPLSLYFHNAEPRKSSIPYKKTYDAYVQLESTYKRKYLSQFNRSIQGQMKEELEDFFIDDVRGNYNRLYVFFAKLEEALEAGYELEVGIQGFASPRASAKYNKLLTGRRVSSVRLEMMAYNKGILNKHLNDGSLKIREIPMGEAEATGVSDALDDPINSVYSVDASKLRKVNFMVVELEKE